MEVIAEENRRNREQEAYRAEEIVIEEERRMTAHLFESELEPTISELVGKCEDIRVRELRRTLEQLKELAPDQKRLLDICTASIVGKILHDPIVTLKREAVTPERSTLLDVLRTLFRLTLPAFSDVEPRTNECRREELWKASIPAPAPCSPRPDADLPQPDRR